MESEPEEDRSESVREDSLHSEENVEQGNQPSDHSKKDLNKTQKSLKTVKSTKSIKSQKSKKKGKSKKVQREKSKKLDPQESEEEDKHDSDHDLQMNETQDESLMQDNISQGLDTDEALTVNEKKEEPISKIKKSKSKSKLDKSPKKNTEKE